MMAHGKYSHERMATALETQESRLHKCPNMYYYLEMLQDIYNYKLHTANKIDFLKDSKIKYRERQM